MSQIFANWPKKILFILPTLCRLVRSELMESPLVWLSVLKEYPWLYEWLLFWTVVWMLLLLLQHKCLAELKSALMTCWFGSAWIIQQFIRLIVVFLNSRSLRFSTFHPIMVRFTRKPQNWARSQSRSSACVLSVGTLWIWHLKPVTAS